jgi:hypothetical protein
MRIFVQPGATQLALSAHEQPAVRWTAQQRAQTIQRVTGAPVVASGEVLPNRHFNDLWLRFVSSVAQLGRQRRCDAPAPDQWQVVDRLGTLEMGGAINAARHRTMAESGGAIVEWLAAHWGADLAGGIDDALVDACQRWVAATGIDPSPPQALSHSEVVELSRVVSRYIGETEKNLEAVFGRFGMSDAALRFDQTDALLGRRTGGRDSHDRYANLETNPLLQRLQNHG